MDRPESTRGSPLRCRDFRSLWLAALVFKIGHPIQIVAGVWLMLELSDSAMWVGMMTAAPMLPLLVVSIPAGAIADARGPRRVLLCAIGAMALGALAIAALTTGDIITPLTLLALELVIGIGDAFHVPAWQASVPSLVPKSILPDAVALEVGAAAVAWAIGPALGGLGIATLGPTWTFLIATSTYGVMIAALMRAHALRKERDPFTSIPTAIGSGLRHVRHTPAYRQVLAVAASFGLAAAGLQALLPTFTSKTLDANAVTYGMLLGSMGAGAILGALARRHASALLSRFMLPVAIAGYGISGVLIGVSRSVPMIAITLIAAGVAWTWILSTLNASMQFVAPEWVRARVMSVYVAAQFGLLSVGSVLAGALGTRLSTPVALVLGSLATVGVGIVAARLRLPVPEELEPPKPAGLTPPPRPAWANNQPVTVTTTWSIDDDDMPEFLSLTSHLRETCLQSGALRWDLYRDAEHPNEVTEVAVFAGWEQYRRLVEQTNIRAIRVIEGIRKLDSRDGPRQRRLIACNGDELAQVEPAIHSMQ